MSNPTDGPVFEEYNQVEMLFELLSGGVTGEQILAGYPDLEPDDLRAVYAFAARLSG